MITKEQIEITLLHTQRCVKSRSVETRSYNHSKEVMSGSDEHLSITGLDEADLQTYKCWLFDERYGRVCTFFYIGSNYTLAICYLF